MAKVTSINILLDLRNIDDYEQGLKWVLLSLKNTLENIYETLVNETNEIFIDDNIALKARTCIEKMFV